MSCTWLLSESSRRTHLNGRYSVVPWNAPVPLMVSSVAIPLVCGNTVVVRPSEFCPYSSSLVVDALHEVRDESTWNLVVADDVHDRPVFPRASSTL